MQRDDQSIMSKITWSEIPILNNLSGAIAWSLIRPFLSFLYNCYEYLVGLQVTPQEDFFKFNWAQKDVLI